MPPSGAQVKLCHVIAHDGYLCRMTALMIDQMNSLARAGEPFIFIIDFDMERPIVIPASRARDEGILFDIAGFTNSSRSKDRIGERFAGSRRNENFLLRRHPMPYDRYLSAFELVQSHFRLGNSFLLNLTFPTPIETDLDLMEIFLRSKAKYRLLIRDRLVVFSPESFVKIRGKVISSYPMKGTIDAAVPDAREVILRDEKELAEHITIVDLIRNDLGMVASRVRVNRFRYVETIETSENSLLQVSSEIAGLLPDDYQRDIGSLMAKLLPAGSITGAPKKKTVEIIKEAEGYDRGYYTGIFGYFDGSIMDSGVMIRFIEKPEDSGVMPRFKSGGGLTIYSDPASEYQELIDKVYVPFARNHPTARAKVS